MAVRGVIVAIYGQHPVHGDAGKTGGHEDDRLLAVGVWVGRVGLAHDQVDCATGVTSAGGPPFLSAIGEYGCAREKGEKRLHTDPLRTYSLPSRRMFSSMFVASLDATSGSVMRKAERILPSSRGASHCFFCASLPYLASTSMLPVSGAELFVA